MSLYVLMKCNLIIFYFLRPNASTERPFLSRYLPFPRCSLSRGVFAEYGSPNLPDKMDFWAFLCFFIRCTASGTFCTYLVTDQDYQDYDYFVIFTKRLLIVCTSCNTSCNILSRSHVKKGHYSENDAKCTAFLVKMSFICMKMKNHFH